MSDSNKIVNDTEVKLSARAISWAKISALVALLNFLLVLFHFSYSPLRPLYLSYFPSLEFTSFTGKMRCGAPANRGSADIRNFWD